MKVISPLLGFNNNVKHKGRVFHVQTEDSGIRHPHVITHLFADGGRILKTMKTSYAEHLNEATLRDIVHTLMKEQHKAMFVALRDGQFDHIFEDKPSAAAPSSTAAVSAPVSSAPATAPSLPAPVVAASAPPIPPVAKPLAPVVSTGRPMAPDPHGPPPSDGIHMDFRGLDQAAAVSELAPSQQAQNVPPPPAAVKDGGALFTAGVYRTLGSVSSQAPNAGRYAHTRQPAIFGSSRPAQGTSIFGEDLISEKSLDEVILSYLAEDLENEEGL